MRHSSVDTRLANTWSVPLDRAGTSASSSSRKMIDGASRSACAARVRVRVMFGIRGRAGVGVGVGLAQTPQPDQCAHGRRPWQAGKYQCSLQPAGLLLAEA